MILVKARTPSGNEGFFRFSPPPATMHEAPGAVVFHVRDAHGRGPDIQGRTIKQDRVEVLFTQDDAPMSFSDYVIRAGGHFIPSYQLEPYRAALQAWLE